MALDELRPTVISLLAELDIESVEASPQDPRTWTIRGEPLTAEQMSVVCDASGEEFAEAFSQVERMAVVAGEALRHLDVLVGAYRQPHELGFGLAIRRMTPIERQVARQLVDVAIDFGDRNEGNPSIAVWKIRRGDFVALRRELDWRAKQLGEIRPAID